MPDIDPQSLIEMAIRERLIEIIGEGLDKSASQINNGGCEDFALAVLEDLGHMQGVELVWSDAWWKEDFLADIDALRSEGAPLPENIDDARLARIIGQATHAWLSWNGLCFDAEAPQGKNHFLELPIYQRQFSQAVRPLEQL